MAKTATPRIRPPLPFWKAKAESTLSSSSVPETIARARPPKIASSTAPFDSEWRRQIANAISKTAKTSPTVRSAVSSCGKKEASTGMVKAAPE